MLTNSLDACFKQLRAEIRALTYSTICNHKYLGKKLSGDPRKRAMVDIQHRSQIAWMKFNEHRDTLLNRHVSLRLRLKLFDSVITPTIVFGLMTCPLTSHQLQKLEVVRNRMLRSIVG